MSEWNVRLEDEAIEDLDRLPHLVRESVLDKLEWLRNHFSEINPKPLGGQWRGFYKLRVGDYRVIYDIK